MFSIVINVDKNYNNIKIYYYYKNKMYYYNNYMKLLKMVNN